MPKKKSLLMLRPFKMFKKQYLSLVLVGFIGLNFMPPKAEKSASPSGLKNKVENRLEKAFGQRAKIVQGELTKIEGLNLTVSKDGNDYLVITDSKTQFRRKFWGKSSLSEFSLGDEVGVVGRWNNEEKTEIKAVLVRNLSIQKRFGVFFGEVKSLTEGGFVIKTVKRSDQTVTTQASTKFVNRKMEAITISDIKVGDRVRIKGLWDKVGSTITQVVQVKDFSIPEMPLTEE